MNDPEKTLCTPALARPSPEHRRRMDDLFRARNGRSLLARPIPLWWCAMVCVLIAASGLLMWSFLHRPVEIKKSYVENVYYVISIPGSVSTGIPTGFLTDPNRVQVKVFSVIQEKLPPHEGRI